MSLLSMDAAKGHFIKLQSADPRHFSGSLKLQGTQEQPKKDFQQLLFDALDQTNQSQHSAENLSQQMITDPDSVNLHDVTIAMAEARMTLDITRVVLDRAVKAYKEIINIR